MEQMNQTTQASSEAMDRCHLQKIVPILCKALQGNTATQKEVFCSVSQIQQDPRTYICLMHVLCCPQFATPLRTMAGLTLKSALERNGRCLAFTAPQRALLQSYFLSQENDRNIQAVKDIVVSSFVTAAEDIDYSLLAALIHTMNTSASSVRIISMVLEDLRLNSQNYSILQCAQFHECLDLLCQALLQSMQVSVDNECLQQVMKCFNMIIFFLRSSNINWINQYLSKVMLPLLKLNVTDPGQGKLVVLALEGINEIVETKPYIVEQSQCIQDIIGFTPTGDPSSVKRLSELWCNLLLELIESDENDDIEQHMPVMLPKMIQGLLWSHDDLKNVSSEMEVEYQPYGDTDDEFIQETKNYESSFQKQGVYTLRKLSILCIEKLALRFGEAVWTHSKDPLQQLLAHSSIEYKQAGVLLIGVLAQTCYEQIEQETHTLLPYLLSKTSTSQALLIRTTSLWALEKLIEMYRAQAPFILQCLNAIFQNLGENMHSDQQQKHLMLKESAISFLDEILCGEQLEWSQEVWYQVIHLLIAALQLPNGRTLFSVFKAISSVFEKQESALTTEVINAFLVSLCQKWSQYHQKDSVMCPLIECLVIIFEKARQKSGNYAAQVFQQNMALLQDFNRKQLVLRSIDLASSLISLRNPAICSMIQQHSFLQLVHQLIINKDKQLRHFGYGLLSDIAKVVKILSAESFVSQILSSMYRDSEISSNNGLMCVTDLLLTHPECSGTLPLVAAKLILQFLSKANVQRFTAKNFAKMFARLCLVKPQALKKDLIENIEAVCMGLRCSQSSKLTDQAFEGVFRSLEGLEEAEWHEIGYRFQFVVDSFVCYTPLNLEIRRHFQRILVVFRQLLSPENWRDFLSRPIFLPATVTKIEQYFIS